MMFKSNLKIAVRNLLKHKGYSFINLAGLTVGIAVCFLIFLWVHDELSYDRFHDKAGRIYRALWEARFGDTEWKIPLVGVPLAETLEKEFPEVERTVSMRQGGFTLRHGNDFVREDHILFVDDDFFDIFAVTFVAGSPETAMQDPESAVLTTEAAKRYFPDQNPLGRALERNDGQLLKVTAVVQGFPPQSHLQFDFLAPLKTLSIIERRRNQWGSATVNTYVLLRRGENVETLEARLQDYIDKNVAGESFHAAGNYTRYPLQPLTDIHLHSDGRVVHVYLFSIIAGFILLLACINFVNLATARAMKRAREVGIRKALGSARSQLMRQFLAESFVYALLAIFLALGLAELVLPQFNQFAGKNLTLNLLDSPFVMGMLVSLAGFVTLLSGAYPAFFLSSFQPGQILKGSLVGQPGSDRLRQGLVVLQFFISIGLIVDTLVVHNQLDFIRNKRLGFDKEHVLVVHRASALGSQIVAFRERLRIHPLVVDASEALSLPGQGFDSTIFLPEQPANYESTSLTYTWVDEHYIDVLKLKVVAGRNFSFEFPTDSSAFLINQSAAKAIGWQQPLGKHLDGNGARGPVIGVVEDFNFASLRQEVQPLVFVMNRWPLPYLAVRLKPGNVADGIAAVETLWKEFVPNSPFEYSFLDQDYQKQYESEQRLAQLFLVFSVLAILIACLGLFGLVSFVSEQRTKEIAMRKVLGASVAGVVGLLTKDFVKLVLLANLVAWPVAWFAMNKWLQSFAYRIDIAWWVFALAGGLALVIALATVGTQAVRAALANPVEALRYE